jgi:hypothetical protein
VNTYVVVLFVHVAAATALVAGSVIAAPAVRSAVRRARTAEELRAFLSIGRPLAMLNPMAALCVLASGVYLTSRAHFWTVPWVQVGIAVWVLNSVTAARIVKPAIQRVVAGAADGASPNPGTLLDSLRWSPRWTYGGDVLAANDVAVLYLMTAKPGMAGSLLALLVVNAAVFGLRTWRFPSRQAALPAAGATGP